MTFGDTVSSLWMSYYQEQFLYRVMCDGYTPGLGWNLVCGFRVDTFFKRYVRKECLIGDSALAVAAMKSALCTQNSWSLWSAANTYFDVSCLGLKIYESGLYNTDTTMLPGLMGTRYSRLARTEAYLYGSSRLGMDTEEQVIADSLDKVRCVYNPLIKLWHKIGVVDTSKQKFAVVNDSLIQYHTSGLKRYEFSNHLGNVLAVTSDRKIAVDTLSGLKVDFYYADLYSVQDYDPFGMIQVGRSWKRSSKYRHSFNGKEDEDWGVQDFDARMFDNRLGRFLSVDPLSDRMPFISPYSFCYNNPIILVDDDGKIPIVPLLVKASVNALTDIFVQATFAYVFDDDVNSFGDAFQKVNGWQVLISAGEGAFTPGGKSGKFIKAGLMGAGDVVFNASKAYLSDQDYTLEDAGKDFVGGFISDLSGGQVSELIIKYGMKNVVKGFAKIGLDAKTINNLTGLKLTTQATKGIKSLQEQISLHKKKLADYRKNPDAFDNQGHLKRVGNNKVLREKIINARIDGLKKEIKKFEGEIDKLISGKTVPLPKQKSNGTN